MFLMPLGITMVNLMGLEYIQRDELGTIVGLLT
jgi:hypothetical protein